MPRAPQPGSQPGHQSREADRLTLGKVLGANAQSRSPYPRAQVETVQPRPPSERITLPKNHNKPVLLPSKSSRHSITQDLMMLAGSVSIPGLVRLICEVSVSAAEPGHGRRDRVQKPIATVNQLHVQLLDRWFVGCRGATRLFRSVRTTYNHVGLLSLQAATAEMLVIPDRARAARDARTVSV
jgi:hypothetical protein